MTNVFHTGPVTALRLISDNEVLAGIGSRLYLYKIDLQTCTSVREVLPCRYIHGIREKPDECVWGMAEKTICVFGQKSFIIVGLDHGNDVVEIMSDLTEVEDWIWDVTWLQRSAAGLQCLALALGHNVILQWDLNSGSLLQRFHCEERCILYCAKFLTNSLDNLVLAAGTVFNQVVIWSTHSRSSETAACEVFQRLAGHQGVIFSIDYCPKTKRICTVSDDRSIRLYQLHFPTGSDALSLGDWHLVQSSLLHVMYGHLARVWDVKLLSDKIISVGEGGSIWSLAVERNEQFVVTGGGDCSIRLWKLKKDLSEGQCINSSRSVCPQISSSDYSRIVQLLDFNNLLVMTFEGLVLLHHIPSQSWTTLMSDSKFHSYSVLAVSNCRHYITIGNISGTMRVFFMEEKDYTWRTVWMVDKVICEGKIFSIIWVADSLLLTTQPNGVVTAQLIQSFPKIHGKTGVTDVCFHDNQVYTCGRDGHYRQYDWQNKLVLLNSYRVSKGFEWIDKLMITEEGQITFLCFHNNKFVLWSVEENQRLLEITCGGGHRAWDFTQEGKMTRFTYIKSREIVLHDSFISDNHVQLRESLHGKELCDVQFLASLQLSGKPVHIIATCSEDTNIAVVALFNNLYNVPVMQVLKTLHGHISTVRCLSVCHRHCLSDHDDNGNNKSFLMFSGGGRSQLKVWRLHFTDKIERPHINLCSKYQSTSQQDGCHKQVDLKGTNKKCNSGNIAYKGDPVLKKMRVIDSDISQKVGEERKRLDKMQESGMEEEEKKYSNNIESEVYSDQNLVGDLDFKVESLAAIQLIDNGQTKVKKPWKHSHMNSDPETRILDITVTSASDIIEGCSVPVYFLVAACSDTILRFFAFDETEREFFPLSSSAFHNHCVLKVTSIILKMQETPQPLALSAGTDGRVALWDCTQLYQNFIDKCVACSDELNTDNDDTMEDFSEKSDDDDELNNKSLKMDHSAKDSACISPCFAMQCHQSGINSLQISKYKDNQYLVVTGGDDNCLTVSMLSVYSKQPLEICVLTQYKHPTAHAAQITGAWIVSSSQIISASKDQQVCVWDIIELFDKTLQIKQKDRKLVSTADVSNLTVWKNRNSILMALCGVGLEVLEFPFSSNECIESIRI
ncbi:hypothetical protein ACJMK2_006430 [Sinanodonta woodiana]|uniref:tRNA (34-2'-O)-methyltransferase regulator WDR6 n=1 Tax=Sinanodonta woodiana TaxID=1069815 RepID=A0ABD3VUH5_SINWO